MSSWPLALLCSHPHTPHTPHPVVLISAMATEPIIQPKILEVTRNIFPCLPSTFKLLLIFVNVQNSFVMSISLYRCRHQSNIIITQQHHPQPYEDSSIPFFASAQQSELSRWDVSDGVTRLLIILAQFPAHVECHPNSLPIRPHVIWPMTTSPPLSPLFLLLLWSHWRLFGSTKSWIFPTSVSCNPKYMLLPVLETLISRFPKSSKILLGVQKPSKTTSLPSPF